MGAQSLVIFIFVQLFVLAIGLERISEKKCMEYRSWSCFDTDSQAELSRQRRASPLPLPPCTGLGCSEVDDTKRSRLPSRRGRDLSSIDFLSEIHESGEIEDLNRPKRAFPPPRPTCIGPGCRVVGNDARVPSRRGRDLSSMDFLSEIQESGESEQSLHRLKRANPIPPCTGLGCTVVGNDARVPSRRRRDLSSIDFLSEIQESGESEESLYRLRRAFPPPLPPCTGAGCTEVDDTKRRLRDVSSLLGQPKKCSEKRYSHMAAIGFKLENGDYEFRCGGSLISELFVLTAAQCTHRSLKPYVVRMGVLKLSKATTENDYLIDQIINHPMYNSHLRQNDISLIKLARKVVPMKNIRPACIQFDENYDNEVKFSGWGQRGDNAPLSDDLLHADMKITNSSSCEIKELGVEKLQGSQLCVTYRNLEADISCPGDEGGPVQNIIRSGNYKTGEPDIYKIVGISSFGSEVCGTGFPSINTKVSSYIDWIEEIVWPQQ